MKSRKSPSDAGERLKGLRLRMRLTTREVEKLSLQIAEFKRNREYYISHGWLTEIEKGKFTSSIYKLYSLSAIYYSGFTEILEYFGLSPKDVGMEQMFIPMPRSHLLPGHIPGVAEEAHFPVELADADSSLSQTRMVSRLPEGWERLPLSVLERLRSKDKLIGYIGLRDFTLYPLIRPGSFVEIHSGQNKVVPTAWNNEHDRPIYFVDLRDRYVCSWCQVEGHRLSVIPHPVSGQQIQTFKYPEEAEIVGRVTAVAMRIADLDGETPIESLNSDP